METTEKKFEVTWERKTNFEGGKRYIFVDFEMNPISKKHIGVRSICSREICEIGAVMLNDRFEEIDSLKLLIRPEYNNCICKKIEELTGISTNMLAGADTFENAYKEFVKWCGTNNYEIYAWSDCDRQQVEKEMLLKKCNREDLNVQYMFEHWMDFQKIFGDIIGTERAVSLEDALNACGIPFLGRQHDALYDARNTSLLYKESKLNDISKCIKNMKNYIDADKVITLGDLFDFGTLRLNIA